MRLRVDEKHQVYFPSSQLLSKWRWGCGRTKQTADLEATQRLSLTRALHSSSLYHYLPSRAWSLSSWLPPSTEMHLILAQNLWVGIGNTHQHSVVHSSSQFSFGLRSFSDQRRRSAVIWSLGYCKGKEESSWELFSTSLAIAKEKNTKRRPLCHGKHKFEHRSPLTEAWLNRFQTRLRSAPTIISIKLCFQTNGLKI